MLMLHNIFPKVLFISDRFRIFAPMEEKKEYLSDSEIYEGLLNDDINVINQLFYGGQFDEVVTIIQESIFRNREAYSVKAEIFNNLYFLFKDKRKLREYETEGGSIIIWLARKAIAHYQEQRSAERKKNKRHDEIIARGVQKEVPSLVSDNKPELNPEQNLIKNDINERIRMVVDMMDNEKYAEIMRRKFWGDEMPYLSIDSTNISQDRKRANEAFTKLFFKIGKKIIYG